MLINFSQIQIFLNEKEISHFTHGNSNHVNQYQLASIYNPINAGFYFCVGTELNLKIKESLIITNEKELKCDRSNTLIVIEEDPQQTYYSIVSCLFSRKSNGIISKNVEIHKDAKIGNNVQIDPFVTIGDCVINDNVIISSCCQIYDNTTIGDNTIIESNSIIGTQGVAWVWAEGNNGRIVLPQLGGVIIGKNCFLGANTIIVRGSLNENTEIGDNTLMAPGVRLGHGTIVGPFCHLANAVVTGGNTKIGGFSFIGSSATFRPKVKISEFTIVGAGAVVIKDEIKSGMTLMGIPAKSYKSKSSPKGMPKLKIFN